MSLEGAASDLLPLARRLVAVSGSMRGPGYVELPVRARAFILHAACLGVARFLEDQASTLGMNVDAAADLAPRIALRLRSEATGLGPEARKQ